MLSTTKHSSPQLESKYEADQREIELLRSGDRIALQRWLIKNEPAISRYVAFRMGTREKILHGKDDVVQEVILRVQRDVRSFRGEGSFMNWVRSVAEHCIFDAYRRANAEKRGGSFRRIRKTNESGLSSNRDVVDQIADNFPSPGRNFELSERRKAILRAIKRLPVDQKRVIVLRHFQHLDVRKTAAVMGKTLAAVNSLHHRAFLNLKAILKSWGSV